VSSGIPTGAYTVIVTGSPGGDAKSAGFTVGSTSGTAYISLNPTFGVSGTVTVSGYDFSSSDSACSISGTPVLSPTCSVLGGTVTGSFTISNVAAASYTVEVMGNTGDFATSTFTVGTSSSSSSGYSISVYPPDWTCGEEVQITFAGPIIEQGRSGHTIEFQFVQTGTGSSGGYQSNTFYTQSENFYQDNPEAVTIAAVDWDTVNFQSMSTVIINVIDESNVNSQGTVTPVTLLSYTLTEMPETCNGASYPSSGPVTTYASTVNGGNTMVYNTIYSSIVSTVPGGETTEMTTRVMQTQSVTSSTTTTTIQTQTYNYTTALSTATSTTTSGYTTAIPNATSYYIAFSTEQPPAIAWWVPPSIFIYGLELLGGVAVVVFVLMLWRTKSRELAGHTRTGGHPVPGQVTLARLKNRFTQHGKQKSPPGKRKSSRGPGRPPKKKPEGENPDQKAAAESKQTEEDATEAATESKSTELAESTKDMMDKIVGA